MKYNTKNKLNTEDIINMADIILDSIINNIETQQLILKLYNNNSEEKVQEGTFESIELNLSKLKKYLEVITTDRDISVVMQDLNDIQEYSDHNQSIINHIKNSILKNKKNILYLPFVVIDNIIDEKNVSDLNNNLELNYLNMNEKLSTKVQQFFQLEFPKINNM